MNLDVVGPELVVDGKEVVLRRHKRRPLESQEGGDDNGAHPVAGGSTDYGAKHSIIIEKHRVSEMEHIRWRDGNLAAHSTNESDLEGTYSSPSSV